VELNEFHVADPAAGAPGSRDAVAGRGVGVGGVEVDLARAAGAQHGVRRDEGLDLVGVLVEGVGAQAAALAIGAAFGMLVAQDQVGQHMAFEHLDIGCHAHAVDQGVLDGGAGGVGHMHDAAVAVAALARQVQLALVLGELGAHLAQPADGLGRVLDREAGRGRVAQAGAGDEGVLHMGLEAVVVGQHGRNAALGPAARAVGDGALGQDGDLQMGGQQQGGAQAGQAAADDDDIEAAGGGGGHCGGGVHGGKLQVGV